MDRNLRNLERDAARGDPDAIARLERTRGRAGVVPEPEERSWTAPPRSVYTPSLGYPEPGEKGEYLPGGPKFDDKGKMTKAPGEEWLGSHSKYCKGCSTCNWREYRAARNPPKKLSAMGRLKKFFAREGLTSPQRRLIS